MNRIARAAALVILLGAASVAGADSVLIPEHATWKYDTSGTDLGTAWRAVAYDDALWPAGPGPLGYGDAFIATPVPFGPDPNNKWRTTYFRHAFSLGAQPAGQVALKLRSLFDDGFVAYLNGVEIARRSMPGGTITYTTFATGHEAIGYEFQTIPFPVASLIVGTNVLAVEVHQSAANSSDMALDLELTLSKVNRGPYLQIGTPNSVIVRWRTLLATDSRVSYGTDVGSLVSTADVGTVTTEHEVPLTGLSPDTRYFYSIGSTTEIMAGGDSSHTFVTSPVLATEKPTRIWVIGDAGTANSNQRAVKDAFVNYTGARGADFWLMLGDNAYNSGTDVEYQNAVFDMYPEMLRRWVLWPTRGNHEGLYAGVNNDYYDIFTMPSAGQAGGIASGAEAYYSFDYGNIHFICLDSEGSNRSAIGAMMTWLRNDIAATTQDWVIAFWHHPPYSKGSHDSDDPLDSGGRMKDMRDTALPFMDEVGMDLVLTGHSHSYERSFLLDGHYGVSTTLTTPMKVDSGDGRANGDGAYEKLYTETTPHSGAVYVVAGSSGQISGGTLNHPVMITSQNVLGSLVLDVDGWRLDARFLDAAGVVRDSFTILKGTALDVGDGTRPRGPIAIEPGAPNPSANDTRIAFAMPAPGPARVSVLDVRGRRVRGLTEGTRSAGRHELVWDGRDDGGNPVAPGVYFVLLEAGRETWARKLVRLR